MIVDRNRNFFMPVTLPLITSCFVYYLQEALAREQMLENKLALLQRLVGKTGEASEEAWKSLIDEDRLLTRVEILESQLSTYGKAMTEDKLREETQRLMGEKELYQETAKETLKKLVDEKLEAVKKQKELEKALSNTEDEYGSLKELYEKYVQENRELALQVNRLRNELEEEIAARLKLSSTENGEFVNIIIQLDFVQVKYRNTGTYTTFCISMNVIYIS